MNLITTFILFFICFSLFRIKLECQRFILESGWKGNQLVEQVLCKLAVVLLPVWLGEVTANHESLVAVGFEYLLGNIVAWILAVGSMGDGEVGIELS
jgi:hypothetical protein